MIQSQILLIGNDHKSLSDMGKSAQGWKTTEIKSLKMTKINN